MPLELHPISHPLRLDAHGVARVVGSRVTLDSVVSAFLSGESAEGIVECFPTLALSDIHLILGYYLAHRQEVDAYLAEERKLGEELRAEVEREFGQHEFKNPIRARKAAQGQDRASA